MPDNVDRDVPVDRRYRWSHLGPPVALGRVRKGHGARAEDPAGAPAYFRDIVEAPATRHGPVTLIGDTDHGATRRVIKVGVMMPTDHATGHHTFGE